jgi:hypothetical protein
MQRVGGYAGELVGKGDDSGSCAAPGNSGQAALAASRDLPGYEIQPGGKFSSAREYLALADR